MGTETGTGLLHAFVLDGRGGASQVLDWDGVARWRPEDGVLWLALDYTRADAAAWLADASGIDPVIRDGLLDTDPRPRAVANADGLLVVTRGINQNAGSAPEDMVSLRSWIEARRVVTLRHRRSRSLESVADDVRAGRGPRDAADVTVELVERVVEHVVDRVDSLGDAIAACEDQALSDTRRDLRGELADLRRRAIALHRFLAPQRDALTRLAQAAQPWFQPSHRARLTEQVDRMARTVEELDAARDRAAVTHEQLASRLAEQTNQRLYVLSLITAVFMPLGFLCALLGVNVGGVPFKDDDAAFWILCAIFAISVGVQIWLFRRRGWLGRR